MMIPSTLDKIFPSLVLLSCFFRFFVAIEPYSIL